MLNMKTTLSISCLQIWCICQKFMTAQARFYGLSILHLCVHLCKTNIHAVRVLHTLKEESFNFQCSANKPPKTWPYLRDHKAKKWPRQMTE